MNTAPVRENDRAHRSRRSSPTTRAWRGILPYAAIVAAVATLVGAIAAFSFYQEARSQQERAELVAQAAAQMLEQNLAAALDRVDLVLQSVVAQYRDQARRGRIDTAWFNAYLARQESLLAEITNLRVADEDGVIRFGSGFAAAMPTTTLAEREFFVRARGMVERDPIVGGPFAARIGKERVIVVGRRIVAADGRFAGLVYANIEAARFDRVLASIGFGSRGVAAIRTLELDLVQARFASPEEARSEHAQADRELGGHVAAAPATGLYRAGSADAHPRSVAYRRVADYPFYVVIGVQSDDDGIWQDDAAAILGLVLLTLLVAGCAARYVYRLKRRLAAQRADLGQADAQQKHLARALQLLRGVHRALDGASSEEALLLDACRLIVDRGAYRMAWVGVANQEKGIRPVAQYGAFADESEKARPAFKAARTSGEGPAARAIVSGAAELGTDAIALPLVSDGQTLAVLSVHATDAQTFVDDEIKLLRELAGSLAHGVQALRLRALNASTQNEIAELDRRVERQAAEHSAELASARLEAERANSAKSRFLAAASHDLRQPLSALSLYVGALAHRLSGSEERLLANMKNCVANLNDMLGKLVDLSRLDAGVVVQKVSDFSIDALIATVVSAQSPEAKRKKLSLRFGCANLVGRTDPALFQRIIENLVSNAIKYTQKGGVLIACRRAQGKTWVEVWDTGVGIPADKVETLFEAFRELGQLERSQAHGKGLGLAIVARTAALLGLTIRVRSKPGRGSVFAVELPLSETATLPAESRRSHRAQRIALVEDNADVATALAYALIKVGHDVVCASSRGELLPRLGGQAPDIVISDYRLTGDETGCDVISAVRTVYGADLPALIITADTDPAVIQHIAAGKVGVQHKPLDLEALRVRIAELTA